MMNIFRILKYFLKLDMRDITYIKYINESEFLNENTKEIYLSRLEVVQKEIWKNCKSVKSKVGKGKCLHYYYASRSIFRKIR